MRRQRSSSARSAEASPAAIPLGRNGIGERGLWLALYFRGMPLPRVQPIIPTSRNEPFDDPEWLFELKYDGFRALYHLERGRHRLISRRGHVLDRFAALGEQMAAELAVDEAILDGEVIAADATGRPQFYKLLRRARASSYVAFDLLWLERHRPAPFASQRAPAAPAEHSAERIGGDFRSALGSGPRA
jgi:ATP-dependent DNA ligase